MACIPVPAVVVPTLPAPLSIDFGALPSISTPGLCCNLLAPITLVPPIPLPAAVLNPAVLATINAALHQVQDFLDHLEVPCPRAA